MYFQLRGVGISGTVLVHPPCTLSTDIESIYRELERAIVNLTFKIPALRQKTDAQIAEALASIDEKVASLPPGVTSYRKLPKLGMSNDQIVSELEQ